MFSDLKRDAEMSCCSRHYPEMFSRALWNNCHCRKFLWIVCLHIWFSSRHPPWLTVSNQAAYWDWNVTDWTMKLTWSNQGPDKDAQVLVHCPVGWIQDGINPGFLKAYANMHMCVAQSIAESSSFFGKGIPAPSVGLWVQGTSLLG